MTLLVDATSAARELSGDELRHWAADRSVFVSSVMDELGDERQAVAAALRGIGVRPILFEDLGGRDEPAQQAYLAGVTQAGVYLGIIGDRYGSMLPSGRSATHEEYRHARELGKRITVWVQAEGDARQGNERDFLDEIRLFHTTGRFVDATDLAERVVTRMAEIAADDQAPWAKLGDAVFRAERIRDRGDEVTIDAQVRDRSVSRYLEELRPGRALGAREQLPLTIPDRSGGATVEEVISETRSQATRAMTLKVSVGWADGRGGAMDAGTSGYSADELMEIGLRSGLLREALPPELQGPGYGALLDVTDPLQALLGHHLPEGMIEPVAYLLVTEHLVGSGHASHIDRFALGPTHQGTRRVALTYTDPRRYSNQEPVQRQIEGTRPW